jgi:hypothetical protein
MVSSVHNNIAIRKINTAAIGYPNKKAIIANIAA